jgi:hypothetical protein
VRIAKKNGGSVDKKKNLFKSCRKRQEKGEWEKKMA